MLWVIRHEMPCLAVRRPVASGASAALSWYVEAPAAAPAGPTRGGGASDPTRYPHEVSVRGTRARYGRGIERGMEEGP